MTLVAGLDGGGAFVIDGGRVSPSMNTTEDVVNPATEELVGSWPVGALGGPTEERSDPRTSRQRRP